MKPWMLPAGAKPTAEQRRILQSVKLILATPGYWGMVSIPYMMALDRTRQRAQELGVDLDVINIHGGAYIDNARNILANNMMNYQDKHYTHLLFLDADQAWEPESVFELILTQKDIVGAFYPKRSMNWKSVEDAIRKGWPAKHLNHVAGDFPIVPWANCHEMDVTLDEPLAVTHLPTGFLLISRKALQAHIDKLPNRWNDWGHEWFRTGCWDRKNPHRWVGEDIGFCEDMRELGFKLHACLWMVVHHYGAHLFEGCIFCSTGNLIHRAMFEEKT